MEKRMKKEIKSYIFYTTLVFFIIFALIIFSFVMKENMRKSYMIYYKYVEFFLHNIIYFCISIYAIYLYRILKVKKVYTKIYVSVAILFLVVVSIYFCFNMLNNFWIYAFNFFSNIFFILLASTIYSIMHKT